MNQYLKFSIYIFPILILTSCTNSSKDLSDTLQVAITSQPQTLDPRFATDANGQYITGLIFSCFAHIGPELKPVNDAAKSWTYDNLTYTFELHKDLRFSNGYLVTKDDILFSLKEYTTKGPFKSALDFIKEFKVSNRDDHIQVQLILSRFRAPFSLFTDISVIKILPKNIVEKYGNDFSKHLIGSGYFSIEKQSSNEITLKARKQHHIVDPKVKKHSV